MKNDIYTDDKLFFLLTSSTRALPPPLKYTRDLNSTFTWPTLSQRSTRTPTPPSLWNKRGECVDKMVPKHMLNWLNALQFLQIRPNANRAPPDRPSSCTRKRLSLPFRRTEMIMAFRRTSVVQRKKAKKTQPSPRTFFPLLLLSLFARSAEVQTAFDDHRGKRKTIEMMGSRCRNNIFFLPFLLYYWYYFSTLRDTCRLRICTSIVFLSLFSV